MPVMLARRRPCAELLSLVGGKVLWPMAICFALMGLMVVQVVKRLPSLKKVDGVPVSLEEREAAEASRA